MPNPVYRTVAHDDSTGRTYLYATRGKDKLVLALGADMKAKLVRTVTAPSETMWVAGNRAVFWAIDRTVVVPLDDATAKAKTLKQPTFSLEAGFAGVPAGLFAVGDDAVFRFDGDRWTCVDGQPADGLVLEATLHGLRARPLAGTANAWKTLATYEAVRATLSVSGKHCFVGLHAADDSFVIGLDGSKRTTAKLPDSVWGSAGFADGFFAWSSHRVWKIGFDGRVVDTKIVEDVEASDSCLVRAGDAVYFVMAKAIWRHRAGKWTEHAPAVP